MFGTGYEVRPAPRPMIGCQSAITILRWCCWWRPAGCAPGWRVGSTDPTSASASSDMDANPLAMLDAQVGDLEQRIKSIIAQEETSAAKARLLLSTPWIGPVSEAMLIAEMPELGRMTSGEAAAMTCLAPIPHDNGAMRRKRAIARCRRALRPVLFQAALASACHNSALKPVAQTLRIRGKPHKLVIVTIARRLVTIASAILKTGVPWQPRPGRRIQLPAWQEI